MAFTPQPDGDFVPGANSYVDVAAFRDFWGDRDSMRLTGLTDGQIQEGCVNASEWIDQYPWVGLPTSDDPTVRRLAWPRAYAVWQHGNARYRAGFIISSAIVPTSIRDAVCVVAMEDILERVNLQDDPRTKLTSKTIGPIKKDFAAPLAGRRFPAAEALVAGLWKVRTGPPGSVNLTNGGSGFAEDDRPQLVGVRQTDLEGGMFPGGAGGNRNVR